jgi:small conductance mechanosensitive channel
MLMWAKEVMTSGWGQIGFFLLVMTLTYLVEKFTRKYLESHFKRSARHMRLDHTQFVVFRHSFTPLIYLIGIGVAIFSIPALKTISISLFAGAGVVAVIVGFAAQKAVANIISGIFIAIFKPFRVDDFIEFIGGEGYVEDITLRHTIIRNLNNVMIVVPNSVMGDAIITNYHLEDKRVRNFIDMSISYDSDSEKAMKIMEQESMNHPSFLDVREPEDKENNVPAVPVYIVSFGESSVNLRAMVWAWNPDKARIMRWELNKIIKDKFDIEGIEIPYPYRTITYKDAQKKKKHKSSRKKTKNISKK